MLLKILTTTLASFLLFTGQAQNKTSKIKIVNPAKAVRKQLCVNDTYYSMQQMKAMAPFANAVTVKVVSFSKAIHGKKSDEIIGIIKNGKADTTSLLQKITLDTAKVNMLANILFNYGNKQLPPAAGISCFVPNNAILFYDKEGNITSCIQISFGCETIMKLPADLEIGSQCSVKFDLLRALFEKAGIHYFGDFD